MHYSFRLISQNFMGVSGNKNESKTSYQKMSNTIQLWVPRVLGASVKVRKATISFIMSVYPLDRMEKLGSHWTNFHDT